LPVNQFRQRPLHARDLGIPHVPASQYMPA
jgi:hypothetical protein